MAMVANTQQRIGQTWRMTVRGMLAAGVLALGGCAGFVPIDTTYTSRNQDSRAMFLVLHYTDDNFPISLKTLTEGKVSSHYLVDDNPPRIYRLVDENRRAWHAGVSEWQGVTALNAASIGIEIVNAGAEDTPQGRVFTPYPPEQIDLVIRLVKDIAKRHQIKPSRIIGHSDIAPQRKIDPGPLFPWKRLADEGLIPWPDAGVVAGLQGRFDTALPDVKWFQDNLAKSGYGVPRTGELDAATRRVIAAFQMKYRPARYDGEPDAETAALLAALLQLPRD